jgi:hypothetical protein
MDHPPLGDGTPGGEIPKWGGEKMIRGIKNKILLAGIVIAIFLPPVATKGFPLSDLFHINAFILTHSIRHDVQGIYPIFNGITILLLCGVVCRGYHFSRIFSVYLFLAYSLTGMIQNISYSDQYGFAVSTSTLGLTLLVAVSWLQEVFVRRNVFASRTRGKRIFVFLPIIVLALWLPVNPATMLPDFQLGYFFSSGSSLTFCMLTIIALSVLISYYPNINFVTLRATSLAGFFIGVGNLWLEFLYHPNMAWIGVLHIPLVVLSITGLIISNRRNRQEENYSRNIQQ